MANHRILSLLGFGASLFALCVIELGAFTRLMDAGLGCPDWPGCYGHLIVPATEQALQSVSKNFPTSPLIIYKAWAEMIHRYFVGGLSIFILSIITFIFCQKTLRSRANILLSLGLIILLLYQILLGRWTVTLKLLPVVVTQHLLGGFFILAVLWLIFLINRKKPYPTSLDVHNTPFPALLFFFSFLGMIILLFQISLGAWTSTNYASLSCPDIPFCHNNDFLVWHFKEAFNVVVPMGLNYEGGVLSEAARQTIQMTHRVGALIFTLYMFGLMTTTYFFFPKRSDLLKILHIIIGLIVVQVCLGITNVLFKLPLGTAIAHNLLAALLWVALITLNYKIVRPVNENSV